MQKTKDIMGMPITVEIVGGTDTSLDVVFDYFMAVDARFSTYKPHSEISKINRGELATDKYSPEMKEIFSLAEQTKKDTGGYFDIFKPDRSIDPSGLVKGWAIRNAAQFVQTMGYKNYFLDAGGDIQSSGIDAQGGDWTVGIRNPFNRAEVVKALRPQGRGVATSGTAARGQHIYNPHKPGAELRDIVSITVVGPDVYEADRFATAAFAMGRNGIVFIEQLPGLEGYSIDAGGIATMTSGFEQLTQ
jgi:thiamine biosynthesis lipoprotein